MSRGQSNVCPVCGEGKLRETTGEFATEVKGPDGLPINLAVPKLTWRHCDSCGEDLLGEDASAAITMAHRTALKLLTADQIRSIRQRLGKTQAQMSGLLGIGEKTYCRWESGTHFQSEAFDRYLRVLQTAPELVGVLNDIRRQKELTLPSPSFTFTYLENVSAFESTNDSFTQLLRTGCFQLQSS
jgi:putative zinc finger/helix-turn-helix YgiT family protein